MYFRIKKLIFIVKIAKQLQLYAVQLHGSETAEFITALRHQLSEETQIWKAISVSTEAQSAVNLRMI